MRQRIRLNGHFVFFELSRKNVKNINIRIKAGGQILVSAGKNVPFSAIEELFQRKADWILRVLEEMEQQGAPLPEGSAYLCGQVVTLPADISKEDWQKEKALELLPAAYEQAWQLFQQDGFEKPALRLRKMKSRWGSCIPGKGIITLNTALIGAEPACQVAVAAHELCHMLHPNHSRDFHIALEQHFPDYPRCWEKLKSAQKFLLDL